nr:MAG TPA: hypothetical protein [Caudoviricetes sp.]
MVGCVHWRNRRYTDMGHRLLTLTRGKRIWISRCEHK